VSTRKYMRSSCYTLSFDIAKWMILTFFLSLARLTLNAEILIHRTDKYHFVFLLLHSSSSASNFWPLVVHDAIYKNFKGILLSLATGSTAEIRNG